MSEKITQKRKILRYLARRGRDGATAMELIERSGSTNVRARISELRKESWEIVNMTPKELRQRGVKSEHKRYYLKEFAPKVKVKAEDAA